MEVVNPYFLRAIQVYSAKYAIADKCKYYLSEVKDEQAYILLKHPGQ